jgi:hypothetical protein
MWSIRAIAGKPINLMVALYYLKNAYDENNESGQDLSTSSAECI